MRKPARRQPAVPAVRRDATPESGSAGYGDLVGGIAALLEQARRASARAVNALMTATYWEIGRPIVEYEQGGNERAEYGEKLLKRLARDLTARFGRGFSERNLEQMRVFYLAWPISQTLSAESEAGRGSSASPQKSQTPSAISCAQKNAAQARYALDNLPNKVLAAEYRTALPDENLLPAEIAETRRRLEARGIGRGSRL